VEEWTFADGWILAATCLVQKPGGARLADVIAAADFIDHAIPTAGELSRTFSRLAACGLLRVACCVFRAENKLYAVSEDHLPAIKTAMASQGGMFDYARNCLRWLNDGGFEATVRTEVAVSNSEVVAAYEEYRAKLKKQY